MASGANYLLVSGLKPRGKLGKRLMIQRENLQERYREREVLVREKMGVGRERMRVRQVRAGWAAYGTPLWCFLCTFCCAVAVLPAIAAPDVARGAISERTFRHFYPLRGVVC